MKFNLHVAHLGKEDAPWIEDYNKTDIRTEKEAREWAEATVENFNNTLRPGEKVRKLLDVTFEGNDAVAQHDWQKMNAITVVDPRMGVYDIMECKVCFITAKRYGLTNLVIDRQWRAKKYKSCNPEAKQ
jgi:hypothetical protein